MSSRLRILESFRRAAGTGARALRLVTIASLLGISPLPNAAEPALTLEGAQRLAIERSRQMEAEELAAQSAREMAIAAGQLPDPVVRVGIDNLPISGSDKFSLTRDFMTMGRVGLMQELVGAEKRRLRADRFEREADKARAQQLVTAATTERDTALAWLDRYYAEAIAAVIDEFESQARLELQAAEGAYRAGRGNQSDIFVAQSAMAMFDDRASEARRKVRNAKIMLARWIGGAAERPLAGEPAIEGIRLDPATLEQQLLHHPQIAVLDQQVDVAAADAKLARANRESDWSVEVAYQQRGSSYSNMISIGISIPWQWDRKNRQDRELAAKLAAIEQARALRDEVLRAHAAETRAMVNEWENGRERQARYQRELVPLASERIAATIAAYRGGKANLSDVLSARRNEIDVRIQALQLAAETARWWAQINFLLPSGAHGSLPPVAGKGNIR